jgi:NAD(P)-dependent dehydrogenase (short-subunit alcohol dehydrogenase family)
MSGRLAGKVALITGTGGGQGRAAAVLFAKEGARIVGCDLKAEADQETVEMVRAAGGDMVTAVVDLGDVNGGAKAGHRGGVKVGHPQHC